MQPVSRFVAMALFVVLAALSALLAVPVWRSVRGDQGANVDASTTATAAKSPARVLVITQVFAFTLALTGAALALALIVSLAIRPGGAAVTKPPFRTARTEMDALTRLAESSVAQGAELSRERDVRKRAEDDARLKQQLL